jgi:hypothetical protein
MRSVALLSWWQLRNSLRTVVTEPRKLIPALVVAVAFGFQFFVIFMTRDLPRHAVPSPVADFIVRNAAASHAIVFAVLALGSLGFILEGFIGRALVFNLADVDYLFPSPVSSRVVLAFRLPGLLARWVWMVLLVVYLGYTTVWRAPVNGESHIPAWAALLAMVLWLATYLNIAVALEVVYGLRKRAAAARAVYVVAAVIVAWGALLYLRAGIPGLAAMERNIVFIVLFYPCRLLADVAVGAITGQGGTWAAPQLALFYLVSLAIVLSRKDQYYEASLDHSERVGTIRQARREGNAGAALAALRGRRTKPAKDYDRAYALTPFGRGATAVVWAHLTALAKSPLVNFAAPFAVAFAFAAGVMFWKPEAAVGIVSAAIGYVVYLGLLVVVAQRFTASVARVSLLKPLPLAAWKLVAADVTPIVLQGTLLAWGTAIPLLAGGGSARFLGALLLVAAPPVIACLTLIGYTIVFWYPTLSDKTGQMISRFVMMAMVLVFALGLAPFVAVPIFLHLRWLILATIPLGCLVAGAILLPIAARAFSTVEG